ncbi:hypothetical protein [Hymenobacter sp. GOD-10R]|uniref:hypothetical protein n=1 Tax=Hymenobacter sp. GOD-10R TaxID=3093922 RepID=UPI002D77C22A|nr:hypothetical protein [Hymenobacter sp. GOD-10R]WRQ30709.1 hypothetical protein SD425_10595 [Hymenobacter sp. GOD-10R]
MLLVLVRSLFTLVLLLLLNGALYAQGSLAKLDEQNGWQDAPFEQSDTAFENLVSTNCSAAESTGVSCYTRRTDSLKLGTATLDTVQYTFYNHSLAAVTVTLKGTQNIAAFCKVLQEAYGAGNPSDEGPGAVEWDGERVHMGYTVVSGSSKYEPVLRLVLRSKMQMARYQADQLVARRSITQGL